MLVRKLKHRKSLVVPQPFVTNFHSAENDCVNLLTLLVTLADCPDCYVRPVTVF